MNAMLTTALPLPTVLDRAPSTGPHRRRSIENHCLNASDVARFNDLLRRLGRRQPLDSDQIATAARELCDCADPEIARASISQRVQQAKAAALMLDDPGWAAANEAVDAVLAVVGYVQGDDHLIPDWVPTVGQLDDAIVVEAAGPRLADELADYADFCRMRAEEARLLGCDQLGFGFRRAQWEQRRLEQAALVAQQRQVREHSYLPAAPARFRIH